MKILRYQDFQQQIHYGTENPRGTSRKLLGDIFLNFMVSDEKGDKQRLLSPLVPTSSFCIGLNYRQDAAEIGACLPRFSIPFTIGTNTHQNPGNPIEIPTRLRSDEVDYECELAVVIGKP